MIRMTSLLLLFGILAVGPAWGSTSLADLALTLGADSNKGQVVRGVDGWLFLREELAHIGAGQFWGDAASLATRSTKKEYADPLPALVDFNKSLAEKGIDLYLMVVPPKALVYAEKVDPSITDVSGEMEIYETFYDRLEKEGVKVIDLLPDLQEKARKSANLYCRTDTHFSGDGLRLFAERAARVIQKEAWYEAYPKDEMIQSDQTISILGDLSQMLGEGEAREEIDVHVIADKKAGGLVESDPQSPVILLGDSHTLVFSAGGDLHAKGAGLFDNLSSKLGFAVDLLGVRGSAATPARVKLYQRSKKDADYLKNKKIVIYCFAARELTGSGGWRTIPVSP